MSTEDSQPAVVGQVEPSVRRYPLLGLPAKEGQKELNIECRLCGVRARAAFPWHGRPQGPQCQCNPNTWGNWRRLSDDA